MQKERKNLYNSISTSASASPTIPTAALISTSLYHFQPPPSSISAVYLESSNYLDHSNAQYPSPPDLLHWHSHPTPPITIQPRRLRHSRLLQRPPLRRRPLHPPKTALYSLPSPIKAAAGNCICSSARHLQNSGYFSDQRRPQPSPSSQIRLKIKTPAAVKITAEPSDLEGLEAKNRPPTKKPLTPSSSGNTNSARTHQQHRKSKLKSKIENKIDEHEIETKIVRMWSTGEVFPWLRKIRRLIGANGGDCVETE
ncbi:sodium Bile acid symporter family [Striga asiatica]|uniref:Sodium Bile acid symporter family n=1 Tax=Striga asiatica TaxID=4170 RepID=A0A5A7Q0A6_STRAF|nr:sodium Bile acid symporter family [Striga asiatica]